MKFLRMLPFMALSCAAVGQQELGWRDAVNHFASQGPFDMLSKLAVPSTVFTCAGGCLLMSNGYITEREFKEGLVIGIGLFELVAVITIVSSLLSYNLARRNAAAGWSFTMITLLNLWILKKTDLALYRS